MTDEEIDNLKPGDMIKWLFDEPISVIKDSEILVYAAYTVLDDDNRRVAPTVFDDDNRGVFTVLLDLSTGAYGGKIMLDSGEVIAISRKTLKDECSLVTEIPADD